MRACFCPAAAFVTASTAAKAIPVPCARIWLRLFFVLQLPVSLPAQQLTPTCPLRSRCPAQQPLPAGDISVLGCLRCTSSSTLPAQRAGPSKPLLPGTRNCVCLPACMHAEACQAAALSLVCVRCFLQVALIGVWQKQSVGDGTAGACMHATSCQAAVLRLRAVRAGSCRRR